MSDSVLSRRDFMKIVLKSAFGTLGFGLAVYGYGHEVELGWLKIEQVKLMLPRLTPAFDGYRIVQISDIHKDGWMPNEHLTHIVSRINEQAPDLVVITGDFVTRHRGLSSAADDLVAALKNIRARDGVLAVLGNHDYWAGAGLVREVLRQCQIIELDNTVHTLRRGDEALHMAGLGDIWDKHDRLDLLLERLPASGPAILLSHSPQKAEKAAATERFDLQLSGHTHGGQVLLLPVWPISPFWKFPAGRYPLGSMMLYVNRGLGVVHPYIRVNCRPEITVLTLKTP